MEERFILASKMMARSLGFLSTVLVVMTSVCELTALFRVLRLFIVYLSLLLTVLIMENRYAHFALYPIDYSG